MSTSAEHYPPVIYISTNDGYEVYALDPRLFDSLGGPEERDHLIGALTAARSRGEANGVEEPEGRPGVQPHRRLLVKSPGRIRFVVVDDIDWIGAEGNYVCLHVGETSHLMRETMTSVERQLDPARLPFHHRQPRPHRGDAAGLPGGVRGGAFRRRLAQAEPHLPCRTRKQDR